MCDLKAACLLLVATISLVTGCGTNPGTPTPTAPAPLPNPATPSPTPTAAAPLPPAFVLSGNYTLTLTASPSCALVPDRITGQRLPLPDAVRTQAFDAVVAQQESDVNFDFRLSWGDVTWDDRLPGSLNGNELRFSAACVACTCDDAFGRPIAPNDEVGWCGTGTALIDNPKQISGVFSGGLEYFRVDVNPDGSGRVVFDLLCNASDHRFTLTARE
jgi:hypothetical protein